MLETLRAETFEPRVGQEFRVVVNEATQLPMILSEVQRFSEESARGRAREPFSLTFHDASRTVLPQQMYRVENADMEPMDLFLVPVGPDGKGMRYEAVFT